MSELSVMKVKSAFAINVGGNKHSSIPFQIPNPQPKFTIFSVCVFLSIF